MISIGGIALLVWVIYGAIQFARGANKAPWRWALLGILIVAFTGHTIVAGVILLATGLYARRLGYR